MILEVFFDYACPFCLRGHNDLLEVLEAYPQIEVAWRPCEAHPRPESYGLHSDLCARGMYYARACGADVMAYHRKMYAAAHVHHADLEDAHVLAGYVSGLLNPEDFEQKLAQGAYQKELEENNRLTWLEHGFSAVPSMVLGGRKLNSAEGIGLSRRMMADFLESAADGESAAK